MITQEDRGADGQTDKIKELILQERCVSHGFRKCFAYVYAYKFCLCQVLTDAEYLRKNFKIILISTKSETPYNYK